MTSFNREKYIGQAIESVLKSTYQNIELVIVDDGSNDNTVKIAKSYTESDNRVKVFINEENLGDYPNRNKAASYANGKYLKYVDADDMIYPHGLEVLVNMMEQFPEAGYGLCSLSQDKNRIFPFQLTAVEAYHYHYFGPGLFHKAPLSSIIKKEAFNVVDGFSSLRMAGDFDMWQKLSQFFPVVLMPHGIVWYRKHEEQEMTHYLKFAENYEESFLQNLISPRCPLSQVEKQIVLDQKRRSSIKKIIKNTIKLRKSLVRLEWKRLRLYSRSIGQDS